VVEAANVSELVPVKTGPSQCNWSVVIFYLLVLLAGVPCITPQIDSFGQSTQRQTKVSSTSYLFNLGVMQMINLFRT